MTRERREMKVVGCADEPKVGSISFPLLATMSREVGKKPAGLR